MPNAASPLTVPGASKATEVMSRGTGILATCSAVKIVVDSTEATSMALMALPWTETTPKVVVPSAVPPMVTLTVRVLPSAVTV